MIQGRDEWLSGTVNNTVHIVRPMLMVIALFLHDSMFTTMRPNTGPLTATGDPVRVALPRKRRI